jgi:hypothetical protein
MNSKFFCISLFFLLVFSWTGALTAQEVQKERKFRTLGWGDPLFPLYYTQSDLPPPPDEENPVSLPGPDYKETLLVIPGAFRSPFYSYDPSKPVKIVKHNGSKIVLVTSLDFSNGPTFPLLLFVAEKSGFYKIKVIDDAPTSFTGGSFMFFNYSDLEVKPAFTNDTGVTSATIEPHESKILTPSFIDQKTTVLSVTIPATQKLVYSSNWVMHKNYRYLIFLVNDPSNPGSVHFLRVYDRTEDFAEATPPQ